ncbi:MAG: HIT family protein [Candidatus Omnitrophica bacterium]|nr:HIT family protein [Candidatus Omnitrophota bacterium]
MTSLFTGIIKGEIPCHKIAETDTYLAFLDIKPINPGHTLVIPKKEIDYIFKLPDDLLSGLMVFAKKIAPAIEKSYPCRRLGVMVCGIEVPHCHIHLVPINGIGDMSFANAKLTAHEELAKVAEKIRSNL